MLAITSADWGLPGAFPLAEAAKAHEIGDGGHVAGKLVLTMR